VDPITKRSRGPRVEKLQRGLDHELTHFKFAWRKIKIDGVPGNRTFDAANMVAWLKGFSPDELLKIGRGHISQRDFEILIGEHVRTEAMEKRAKERRPLAEKRRKKHHWLKEHPHAPPAGAPTFDGQAVPAWFVGLAPSKTRSGKTVTKNWMQELRNNGWTGELISGIRTSAHSVELCEAMCGAPSCSGTCAGVSSRHNCDGSCPFPEGAGDFTSPETFNEASAKIDCPLINRLPNDPNHHSVAGN
jgi:hypothetical protein